MVDKHGNLYAAAEVPVPQPSTIAAGKQSLGAGEEGDAGERANAAIQHGPVRRDQKASGAEFRARRWLVQDHYNQRLSYGLPVDGYRARGGDGRTAATVWQ
jgi:hypothetical protein